MCKNLVEIIDAFDLLLEAQDYAEKYPSKAEDSPTNKRFVQFVMTRLLNKMNSLMEVSDTQAAAALLGMNAGICSEIFRVFDTEIHIKFIQDEVFGTNKDSGAISLGELDNESDEEHIKLKKKCEIV